MRDVGVRIETVNCRFYKDPAPCIGLCIATVRRLPRKYRSYTHKALRLSWDKPTAPAVASGSPAARANIASGDRILTLNNE